MTPGDVAKLKLPRDLPHVHAGLAAMLENGENPTPLLMALAERNPLALADVVVGPRGMQDPRMARAALNVIEHLESVVAPSALYRRLTQLAGTARQEVLRTAAGRHPTARWMVQLSAMAEGELAGRIHILHAPAALQPSLCETYARAGAVEGLVAATAELRGDEPALALLRTGNLTDAARAAGVLLSIAPHVPVIERMAAIWGPDIEPMLMALIASAPDDNVLIRLGDYTVGYPKVEEARVTQLPHQG